MKIKLIFLKLTRICIAMFCVIALSSCSNKQIENELNKTLVLDYKAFGPSQLSVDLLGQNYWQWQSESDHSPTQYDIKVVIYRNISLLEVTARYPVNAGLKQDFRYIDYSHAKEWIEKQIFMIKDELNMSAQNSEFELILYDFSRLENMYKLLLNIEQNLRS